MRAVLSWLADRLGFTPPPPNGDDERREQEQVSREATRAIRRADHAIDTWNERIRESWRPDGA